MVEPGPNDKVTVGSDPEEQRAGVAPFMPILPDVYPDFLDQVDRFIERYQPALKALANE